MPKKQYGVLFTAGGDKRVLLNLTTGEYGTIALGNLPMDLDSGDAAVVQVEESCVAGAIILKGLKVLHVDEPVADIVKRTEASPPQDPPQDCMHFWLAVAGVTLAACQRDTHACPFGNN